MPQAYVRTPNAALGFYYRKCVSLIGTRDLHEKSAIFDKTRGSSDLDTLAELLKSRVILEVSNGT